MAQYTTFREEWCSNRKRAQYISRTEESYSGNEVYHAGYDPWGRQTVTTNTIGFFRGYTGHEMLSDWNLINMNGRLYDPVLARFLSPDNYVQLPDNSQSYNRYSYCLNNPLKYTDPDGEFWHLIIGAAIGGVFNWVSHGCKINARGLGYFAVGAAAGALGSGIGAGISSALPVAGQTAGGFAAGFLGTSAATTATSSFISGALIGAGAGFSSGFITGFGNSLLSGENFSNAFQKGGTDALISGLTGFAIGGISGGIDASRDGRRFWDGARMIEEKTIVDMNIPHVASRGIHNCVLAALESVDKSYGGNITQEYLRSVLKGNPNEVGVDVGDAFKLFDKISGGTSVIPNKRIELDYVSREMLNDTRVLLYKHPVIGNEGHIVVLNHIVQRTYLSIGGHVFNKTLYYVMDPSKNNLQRIGASTILNSDIIFHWR